MDKRDIVGQIGEFSFSQRIISITVLAAYVPAAFCMMMMAFGGTIPDWTCLNDVSDNNTNITNVCTINGTGCKRLYLTEWKTVVTEWDLVCEKRYIGFMITSIQMVGILIGSIISGYSSDSFGRKKTFYFSQLFLVVTNIIAIFSNSWQMFAALLFLIGIGTGGVTTVGFPLAVEFVGPRWRAILGAIPAFSLGVMLIPLFLWLVPDWRYYLLCTSVMFAVPLVGWFYVPESIRWLTVRGKIEKAEQVIFDLARKNNKLPPDTKILQTIYEEEALIRKKRQNYSYFDLIKTKSMAKRTAVLSVAWFSQSVAFYCIALGVQNLAGNMFLNMFLLTIVEAPSHLIVLFSANTLGRRRAIAGFYYASGILGIVAAVSSVYVSDNYRGSIVNACAMISNLCVGTAWTIMMVYTTEQYPTVIRNLGYAAGNTMARVGAIFSAQVISLANVEEYLPYATIAVLMVLSGSLILLLDETKGTVLTDSLEIKVKESKESNIYKPRNISNQLIKN